MNTNQTTRDMARHGAIGLLAGISLLAAGIWAGRQLHIVWNIWPSVDGVVAGGTVEEVPEMPSAKSGMIVHRYKPSVQFRYAVGGKEYTTQAASEYTADTYQQAARNLTRMYGLGTHHPIRYNPRNPHDIRFGIIAFGPLAFSFLLLVSGAVLSVISANSLVSLYAQRLRYAPARAQGAPGTILPFEERAGVEPAAVTLRCPACGRPVEPGEDTCPNCLRSLRAA